MAGLKHSLSLPVTADPRAFVDNRTKDKKPRRVPAKVRRMVALILDGTCTSITAASERAGLSRTYASRMLRAPHCRAWIETQINSTLDETAILGAGRLRELIRSTSDHVSMDATKFSLALSGRIPPERSAVNVNVTNMVGGFEVAPGYVVKLNRGREIEHE
jgi:hypothetical protein